MRARGGKKKHSDRTHGAQYTSYTCSVHTPHAYIPTRGAYTPETYLLALWDGKETTARLKRRKERRTSLPHVYLNSAEPIRVSESEGKKGFVSSFFCRPSPRLCCVCPKSDEESAACLAARESGLLLSVLLSRLSFLFLTCSEM